MVLKVGQPGTKGGPAVSAGVLSAQIKVTNRPVTQQGLSGMKTGMRGPQRQILDKSYFLGLLRSKISELRTESSKLQKQIDAFTQENSVYLVYEKRAEGLAGEIKDLQGELADYNMLVDKLNTSADMDEVAQDFSALKVQNDGEGQNMDVIFRERQEKEEMIRVAECEVDAEKQVVDAILKKMSLQNQVKYTGMKTAKEELAQELSRHQQELDALATQKEVLETGIAHSQVKQEALLLHEKLQELERHRDSVASENDDLGSAKERERLLRQVKEDNQEMASVEQELTRVQMKASKVAERIQQLDGDIEGHEGEQTQKYKELKKKEENMDNFLETSEDTKAEERERNLRMRAAIVALLEHTSRNMNRMNHIPSVSANELKSMQEDLVLKETEMHKSQSTAHGLTSESQKLQRDLQKVEKLESKINTELKGLKEKIWHMSDGLCTYNNLNAFKAAAEEKKRKLLEDTKSLARRREAFKKAVAEMSGEREALEAQLHDNETHVRLSNLEKKWQHHEKNNYVTREFIASKGMESDYHQVVKSVIRQLAEYNKTLADAIPAARN